MSILDYFIYKKTLPNPKGLLSRTIPARIIVSPNEKVEKEVKKSTCYKKLIGKKRNVFTPKGTSRTGKACLSNWINGSSQSIFKQVEHENK